MSAFANGMPLSPSTLIGMAFFARWGPEKVSPGPASEQQEGASKSIFDWHRLVWLKAATIGVVLICLIVELVLARHLGVFTWPTDPSFLPLLRLGGCMALGLTTYWFLSSAARSFIGRARSSWWEPGSAPEAPDLSWNDVHKLVVYKDVMDPLALPGRIRWGWWLRSLGLQLPIYLLIWAMALSFLDLIWDFSSQVLRQGGASTASPTHMFSAPGSSASYLALLVGAAAIFFTFRQIRAKVRADSRQQWIIRARTLLGEVVALIDAHRDLRASYRYEDAEAVWLKLNPARIELELMLNPSEKDHRLLMYLIQRFARWRYPVEKSQDARIVRRSMAEIAQVGGSENVDVPENWRAIADTSERGELVSYILRLAHVVLKREWERVKHTR